MLEFLPIPYFSFNPKTYRAIGRRLNQSQSPRYLVSYARHRTLINYGFLNLSFLHQEEISMVGKNGSSERKTAYFYLIIQKETEDLRIKCDSFFQNAYSASTSDIGDRYHFLMNQRLQYEKKHREIVTRKKKKENGEDYFSSESDDETVVRIETSESEEEKSL